MSILWVLFVGLIVGAFARLLMPGRGPAGLLLTSLLGVLGAATARLIGVAGGWYRTNETSGFLASVLGAIFGRKIASVSNLGRATTAARSVTRIGREAQDVACLLYTSPSPRD